MSKATPSKSLWSKLAHFLWPASAAATSGEAGSGEAGNTARARKTIPIAVDGAQAGKGFSCPPSCWGTCCDDTVFLDARDVVAVHQFADRHFARFATHFAKRYLLAGVHNDRPVLTPAFVTHGGVSRFQFFRNAVESELLGPPPHNERRSVTTGQPFYHTLVQFDREADKIGGCVFLTEGGTCFLEEVAVEAGEHRWVAKPEGCALFPLVPLPSGTLMPLASPENEPPDGPNHGLLEKFRDKACCTQVTPRNAVREMSEAVDFVEQARASRTRAFEDLLKTKKVELRQGFLQVFDRRVAGSASRRRR